MYIIPVNFNIDKLKESIIVQICFTANAISIFFENLGFIKIEGEFIYTNGSREIRVQEIFPGNKDWGILNLLEKKVIDISIDELRTSLTIYTQEESLCLLGDPNYESYVISIEGMEIIV